MPAEVNKEKCEGTGDCIPVCPIGCIAIEDNKAKTNPDECIDCNACVDACDKQAIEIKD